jgi:cytochrome c peroxidase
MAGRSNAGAGGNTGALRSFALGIAWLLLSAGIALAGAAEDWLAAVPDGVFEPEVPADNPMSADKVALGRKLYFDTALSTDGSVACATCHDPSHGFADPRGATSAGVGGALGVRNAPTTLNAAFLIDQFWDGREQGLEAQAVQPLVNSVEHGFADFAAVEANLKARSDDYAALFRAAFGDEAITIERVGKAIASFERTLLTLQAPIDRFLAGDAAAISESAKRGWALYNGKARCNNCHGHIDSLPLFTDELYHNLGVGIEGIDFDSVARRVARERGAGKSLDELALADSDASALGRFMVTGEQKDMGAFKTPPLRNVALTAPYMHDGSEATLAAVIEFYDRGGNNNPYLDGGMLVLDLTDQEKADLVELMKTFTSEDLERFDHLKASMAQGEE